MARHAGSDYREKRKSKSQPADRSAARRAEVPQTCNSDWPLFQLNLSFLAVSFVVRGPGPGHAGRGCCNGASRCCSMQASEQSSEAGQADLSSTAVLQFNDSRSIDLGFQLFVLCDVVSGDAAASVDSTRTALHAVVHQGAPLNSNC